MDCYQWHLQALPLLLHDPDFHFADSEELHAHKNTLELAEASKEMDELGQPAGDRDISCGVNAGSNADRAQQEPVWELSSASSRTNTTRREIQDGLHVIQNPNSANDLILYGKGGRFQHQPA